MRTPPNLYSQKDYRSVSNIWVACERHLARHGFWEKLPVAIKIHKINLNQALLEEAMRLGNHKTKVGAVRAALENYLRFAKLRVPIKTVKKYKPKKKSPMKKEHP